MTDKDLFDERSMKNIACLGSMCFSLLDKVFYLNLDPDTPFFSDDCQIRIFTITAFII